MAAGATAAIPIANQFWSLLDKADRKFSKLRELPSFSRHRSYADFQKAFRIYTQLWKLQQENRQKLLDAGLKRWEVGEIASRIGQLYYGQYQRTSDSGYLAEAFVFYEAILSREYFKGEESGLVQKQLRFLARFVIVALVNGKREMASRLGNLLKGSVDENKKGFQEVEYKEWKHVVQETVRFLRADSLFMNMRPLRYSFAYDPHPDKLSSVVACNQNRSLVLRDALLSSYCHNEVKFTELTLDTFRMLQTIEWEPRGFFSLKGGTDSSSNGTAANRANPLQDIRDPTLPPNPRKITLYRPSVTYLLMILSTVCEELPQDGILLIYLSASEVEGSRPFTLSSRASRDSFEENSGKSDQESFSSMNSTIDNPDEITSHNTVIDKSIKDCLWLGFRGSRGSNYLYPCDLIPFTRKPLFLIIDSNNSHAFKVISGEEKGETAVMLLSPSVRTPPVGSSDDSVRNQHGSQFTMFLTAPVQAFCYLIGKSGADVDKDMYDKAEKLFSLSLGELEMALVKSDSLHQAWVDILGDPFLRRIILRFIFCRAVLALYSQNSRHEKFIPSCLPDLPDSVSSESKISQTAVLRLAEFFGATGHFALSEGIALPELANVLDISWHTSAAYSAETLQDV